ncbi:hypothetical protein GGR56DRAFT_546897 [Xylariaceae sp. FL0804]|nr:hypothetical protein GGR56DRAFT_546897 [Xylariaceae sp. FL0804]
MTTMRLLSAIFRVQPPAHCNTAHTSRLWFSSSTLAMGSVGLYENLWRLWMILGRRVRILIHHLTSGDSDGPSLGLMIYDSEARAPTGMGAWMFVDAGTTRTLYSDCTNSYQNSMGTDCAKCVRLPTFRCDGHKRVASGLYAVGFTETVRPNK